MIASVIDSQHVQQEAGLDIKDGYELHTSERLGCFHLLDLNMQALALRR